MRISLVSVGTKMSGWVQSGVDEYAKRIQSSLRFSLTEIPLAQRTKSSNISRCMQKEAEGILAKIQDNDYVITLEVAGKHYSTEEVAMRIAEFKADGRNLVFLAGGPDGLHKSCKARANVQWSLSQLTLPHPLVRILLVEQLYRASSLLEGHPYHRQ